VVAIPTNRGLKRISYPDVIFRTEKEKWDAIVEEIERINKWDIVTLKDREWVGEITSENDQEVTIEPIDLKTRQRLDKQKIPRDKIVELSKKGRPILVGTVSIEKSEKLSGMLTRRGVKHQVLNAKYHAREAEIIAQAGRKGGVTIATNMAGRGTDIILGGNPETMAWGILQDKYPTRLDVPREEWDGLVSEIEKRENMKAEGREVASMGGLHVIGTERHEARRIDLQLMGRCGRQGDTGSSRFYLSLDDDLMRIFAGDWVKAVLTRLGMQEGEAIESRMVSRRIEGAQKKVEEMNFDRRKNLLEYDEVMDEQRKRVYGYRQRILTGVSCQQQVLGLIDGQIKEKLDLFLDPEFGAQEFAAFAGSRLGCKLEAGDFRGMSFEQADIFARDEAGRMMEGEVFDAIEENLPEEEESEWNWEALAKFANSRWGLNFRDKDLKKVGRDEVAELLLERARKSMDSVDLKDGERFLQEDWGRQSAANWVEMKFGVKLDPDQLRKLDKDAYIDLVKQQTHAAYNEREIEFAVQSGIAGCSARDSHGKRLDRDKLVEWARWRFQVDLNRDDLANKQREELAALLIEASRKSWADAEKALKDAQEKLVKLLGTPESADDRPLSTSTTSGTIATVQQWISSEWDAPLTVEQIGQLTRAQLQTKIEGYIEHRYRPEIRRMERVVLLEFLDEGWKAHLLSMDHLRSGIGLVSYAQVDPKVEYKKEGMRIFEEMWKSFGDRVTDIVFRMEQLNEEFVESVWQQTEARKEAAAPAMPTAPASSENEIGEQQQQAIDATQGDKKLEPIRNRTERVGRNDPCPCGSGKKYKNCHMKSQRGVA
jgi:preprotein translocase subunit SecA